MLKITYAALKNPLACKTRGDDAREFFCADEYAAPGWAKNTRSTAPLPIE
jgi:hypothetical protein